MEAVGRLTASGRDLLPLVSAAITDGHFCYLPAVWVAIIAARTIRAASSGVVAFASIKRANVSRNALSCALVMLFTFSTCLMIDCAQLLLSTCI